MDCQRCGELLGAYKDAISLYTTAQRRLRGLRGDDFVLAWKELKRLRQMSLHADEALMEHWREHHGKVAAKPDY